MTLLQKGQFAVHTLLHRQMNTMITSKEPNSVAVSEFTTQQNVDPILWDFVTLTQTARARRSIGNTTGEVSSHAQVNEVPACESKLVLEAAERPQWPRLYSLGRPRSCDRMPSLVGDCGPVLRVLGWALTRMRDISLVLCCRGAEP